MASGASGPPASAGQSEAGESLAVQGAPEPTPHEAPLRREDFQQANWQSVIDGKPGESYISMSQALSRAAISAREKGRTQDGRVLELFGKACSLMLCSDKRSEPFKPILVMGNRRSTDVRDFTAGDLTFFIDIVADIDNARLQARIADILWAVGLPRDVKHALLAIDAYRRIPLNGDSWPCDARDCWARAVRLTCWLGKGSGDRRVSLEDALVTAIRQSAGRDGYFMRDVADLLRGSGMARHSDAEIAEALCTEANRALASGDAFRGIDHFRSALRWLPASSEKALLATVGLADCWMRAAAMHASEGKGSHAAAAGCYESAIQVLRTIPRKRRSACGAELRLNECERAMRECGERSLEELGVIRGPEIDLAPFMTLAREAVSGKGVWDALVALADIAAGTRVTNLRASAEQSLRQNPLQALMAATHIASDGRVVAKRGAADFADPHSEESQAAIAAMMIQQFQIEAQVAVLGQILPALEAVSFDHPLKEDDFVRIAGKCPIVPVGRAGLIGKGLHAGFERNYDVSLHVLVPQVEHLVRTRLKLAGGGTTSLDQDGIETEVGLSALVDLPLMKVRFGEDLTFTFKALLCDPIGPNLRNEVAHGMLGDAQCQSVMPVYLWWLVLRLVVKTVNATWGVSPQVEAAV